MPIFEYRCRHCDHCFETVVYNAAEECGVRCPQCDCAEIEKMLSLFSRSCSSRDSSAACAPSGGGFS